jgi:hypothetical protein
MVTCLLRVQLSHYVRRRSTRVELLADACDLLLKAFHRCWAAQPTTGRSHAWMGTPGGPTIHALLLGLIILRVEVSLSMPGALPLMMALFPLPWHTNSHGMDFHAHVRKVP